MFQPIMEVHDFLYHATKKLSCLFPLMIVTLLLVANGCQPVATPKTSVEGLAGTIASDELKKSIQEVLRDNYTGRLLSAKDNAAWQIMHGVIAYRDQLPLAVDGKQVRALEHAFHNGVIAGWELSVGDNLPTTNRPGLKARLEPGSYIGQGHVDQWIAILAQIGTPIDQEVMVGDVRMTMEDWLRQAQWDVSENPIPEYSWTLMALMHYFPAEEEWMCKDGKKWNFEPLVSFEAKQDLTTSPCGGMHRLMGLAHACRFRERLGKDFTGGWKEAKDRVQDSIELARKYQNADGSFSVNYTERAGNSQDITTAISATGHTLEFLAYALPEEELKSAWVERAAARLIKLLVASKKLDLDCGGLYHALHGLRIYHNRRFGEFDPSSTDIISRSVSEG